MSYCGFSDSSSDDIHDNDDDINNNNNNNNNNWVNSKAQPITSIESIANEEKSKKIQSGHSFNSILAPKTLSDIKYQIIKRQQQLCQQQPSNNNAIYNQIKQHRTNLQISEYIPKSKHLWHQYPKVTGVSAQVSLGIKISEYPFFKPVGIKLFEVIHLLRNVEYKPEEFVAIRMKLRNPLMTVTIFSNGKLTTQGGKSQYSCIIALRKVSRMLQQINKYKNKISHISKPIFYGVQANAHFGYKVDLQSMSESFPNRIEYSPDIQSAYLKFRQPLKYGDKGACHIYHSGRITILGCNAVKTTTEWINDMYTHTTPYFINAAKTNKSIQNHYFRDINNNTTSNNTSAFNGIAPPPLLT